MATATKRPVRRRKWRVPKDAAAARLLYVSDKDPGIRRRKNGRGFVYATASGNTIKSPQILSRISTLVIPPAWTDVWICDSPNGHLQATGRDARGRKQYLYHPRWRRVREENKYEKLTLLGKLLPQIRTRVKKDLALSGIPREKALATVVRLLDTTFLRIGNVEYEKANGSFGLTTLKIKHARVQGGEVEFSFPGKSGKTQRVRVSDARMARIIRHMRDLPGQRLFQYIDENGEVSTVTSTDVNDYLREISGEDITAKDFRTWAGTLVAAQAVVAFCAGDGKHGVKAAREAIKSVAERLGNTPAVCKRSYIHPAILETFEKEARLLQWKNAVAERGRSGLSHYERWLLRFLEKSVD